MRESREIETETDRGGSMTYYGACGLLLNDPDHANSCDACHDAFLRECERRAGASREERRCSRKQTPLIPEIADTTRRI